MELHLKIIGLGLVLLALIHVIFPRYFNWKTELAGMSLMNRQMMQTHTFFIAFTVLLMGMLCLTSAMELMNTQLGNKLSLGLFTFWTIRLFCQFFIYSPKLWRGKKLETTVHIIFSFLWTYMSIVFFLVWQGIHF
ncbi:MAG: hypothetical protein V4543_16550 [Bacteroidota bacterium]